MPKNLIASTPYSLLSRPFFLTLPHPHASIVRRCGPLAVKQSHTGVECRSATSWGPLPSGARRRSPLAFSTAFTEDIPTSSRISWTKPRARASWPGVVTFREHPAAVLSPSFQARYLTSCEDRLDLLGQTKIDFAVPITFDRALSKLTAEEFVSLLQDRLQMVSLVVGPDFAMGRNREGTIERLSELGDQMGFTLTVVDGLQDTKGETVRSTTVRTALGEGEVERVAELLGRRFTLAGTGCIRRG